MKKITFILAQDNGNNIELSLKEIPEGMTQDKFIGMYIFPAMCRLIKGAGKVFDKDLPVSMYFEAEGVDIRLVADVHVKMKSLPAIRTACLAFNQAIAALVFNPLEVSIYDLPKDSPIFEGTGKNRKIVGRKADLTAYTRTILQPSVSMSRIAEVAAAN